MRIVLFVGSVREGRMASRVATMAIRYLAEQDDVEVIPFDAMDKPHLATVKQPIHFQPEPLADFIADKDIIESADGYAIVCGEYNRCIPSACSAMLNNFPPSSYAAKPAIFFNYSMGNFGGVSATMQLREMCTELSMIPVPSSVNIPVVHNAVSDEGELLNTGLETSISRAIKRFMWYAKAMHKIRNDDEFEPFPN